VNPTQYHFRHAVSAFFEMNRDAAKALLPPHLEPFEPHHGLAVFAVTAFDFVKSEVGGYQEIVLAVITPPLVTSTGQWPRSAFYPFVVGTNTEASRAHAIERWHLPHYLADVSIDFDEAPEQVGVRVREAESAILDVTVRAHKWTRVDHLYQSFMFDRGQSFKSNIHMAGEFTEHEEEAGELTIHRHPMTERLLDADVETYPFRELWMKDGVQTFEGLETL
jgi:hypothetical protein